MRWKNTGQLSVRSPYARERALELARQTGMSTTEVVEAALRAYVPSAQASPVGDLVRRGPILVIAGRDGRVITLKETNQAIEAARNPDR